MWTAHVLLLCLLGAALFTSVTCSKSNGPDDCCFTFYPRRVNKKFIASYYLTDHRCPKAALILVTQKGKRICVDPRITWVQGVMKSMDQSSF